MQNYIAKRLLFSNAIAPLMIEGPSNEYIKLKKTIAELSIIEDSTCPAKDEELPINKDCNIDKNKILKKIHPDKNKNMCEKIAQAKTSYINKMVEECASAQEGSGLKTNEKKVIEDNIFVFF